MITAEITIQCDGFDCKESMVIDDPDRNYFTFIVSEVDFEDEFTFRENKFWCKNCYKDEFEDQDLKDAETDREIERRKYK